MGLLVRSLLMWLLVLAIPVQGVAAATMLYCAPKHSSTLSTLAAESGPSESDPSADVHASGHQPDHHAHAAIISHGPGGADGVSATADLPDGSSLSHQCSVCGSCSVCGGLLSAEPVTPLLEPAATAFASLRVDVAPFTADGPERPPRISRV